MQKKTKITSLSQEEKDAIPGHIKKWIEIGLRTGQTDWETFDEFMPICYAKAGIKYPNRVVRVQSPLVGALASSIADWILSNRKEGKDKEVLAAPSDHDDDKQYESIAQVDTAMAKAIEQSLKSDDFIHKIVNNIVDTKVLKDIHAAVIAATGIEAFNEAKTKPIDKTTIGWHYWFGGQFWVGGWLGAPAYVAFYTDVCGLELPQDIMERATAYRRICESVNYIWPNREFVMVCARPREINRDPQGRLHSEHGKSISYPDGWGLYHLHGVRFDEELYLRVVTREMGMKEIMALQNIDQRVQAMKFAKEGIREFYTQAGGKKISSFQKKISKNKVVNYELWRIPRGETFNKEVAFMVYDCPTAVSRGEKREYSKGVPIEMKTVSEAMAWGCSSEEYPVTPEEWELMGPLKHES